MANRRMSEFRNKNDFKEFSRILESVVVKIVQHGGYDMKFQRIYIDINNHLYKIQCNNNDYQINILNTFEDKLKQLLELISNPEKFTNFSIQFEFIYYQLKKMFPNGEYIQHLKLDDKLAEAWWYQYFQNNLYADPTIFWKEFSAKFPKLEDTDCVIKSIAFTQCKWFEDINKISFNLFLKLYGGWNNLENNWLRIYHHPGNLQMVTTENGQTFLADVQKQLGTLRTIHKSYVFCCDWRSTEGHWNMIWGDKDDSIQTSSMDCAELIRELQNYEKYKFPKGKEMPDTPGVCNRNEDLPLPETPDANPTMRRNTLPNVPDSNPENGINKDLYTINSNILNDSEMNEYNSIEGDNDVYVDMKQTDDNLNA